MKTKALRWHGYESRLWAVIMLLLFLTLALFSNVLHSGSKCGWTTSGMTARVHSDTAPDFESAAMSDFQASAPASPRP